jgi:hypothetical protein
LRLRKRAQTTTEKVEQEVLQPREKFKTPKTYIGWLDESTFIHLTSHHPLISPSTDLDSPFVGRTLEILAASGISLYMYAGTAEWFYHSAMSFTREAEDAGIEVLKGEELGGFHVEGCVTPPDLGGPAARLQQSLVDFLCR